MMDYSYFMGSFTVRKLKYVKKPQSGNMLTPSNLQVSFQLLFKKKNNLKLLKLLF